MKKNEKFTSRFILTQMAHIKHIMIKQKKFIVTMGLLSVMFISFSVRKAPMYSVPRPMTAGFEPVVVPEEVVDDAIAKKIERYFQRKHDRRAFNGAVLFAEKGKVIYKGAFGHGDIRGKRDALTTNSPFQLASVTKPMTATAVLMLQDWGYLSVEDSIQKFIPNFPYKGVTVKHLLTQKSGLPEYLYFSDVHWKDWHKTITNDDVLCLMEIHEPNRYYRPDYRYNYVNTNYIVLASIIEKVSGVTYNKFMEKYIFVPLGMDDAFVYQKDAESLPTTLGHDKRRRKIADSHYNGVVGDKGIYASVEDLFRFDQSFYDNALICPETAESAFAPAHRRLHAHDNYGMGWRINTQRNGNKIIHHSGWWKGYTSYFIRMPFSEKTIIVLNNCLRGGFMSTKEFRALLDE